MLLLMMLIAFLIMNLYFYFRLLYWCRKTFSFFRHKIAWVVLAIVDIGLAFMLIFGSVYAKGQLKREMVQFGNFWLGTLIFLLTFIAITDIANLIGKKIQKKHPISLLQKQGRYYVTGMVIFSLTVGCMAYGSIHQKKLYVKKLDITVHKEVPGMEQMKIVLAADLHMGYSVGIKKLRQMVAAINRENPDLVLIAGDLFDNNYDSLQDPEKMIAILRQINSQYGIYAVYGNHDVTEKLVGGFSTTAARKAFRDPRMESFLQKSNIKIMEDEVMSVCDDKIELIGRLDNEKAGDGTSHRKSIEKLMEQCDRTKLVFDLEHEPTQLKQVAEAGVDVMFCGHTHGGQFFPLTIVQPFVWKNHYGLKKIKQMHSIVTYGVGIYGPNIRIGTDSEIMSIQVHFSK